TAGCPMPLQFCSGNAPQDINLMTETQAAVLDGATPSSDYKITFYLTENDAFAGTNSIPNIFQFPQTVPGTPDAGVYDFYVKLEYDPSVLPGGNPIPDCFDVVPFQVTIGQEPNVPNTVTDLDSIGCVDANDEGT